MDLEKAQHVMCSLSGGTIISWMSWLQKMWSFNHTNRVHDYYISEQEAYMVEELPIRTSDTVGRLCIVLW